jgi:plastocyanin
MQMWRVGRKLAATGLSFVLAGCMSTKPDDADKGGNNGGAPPAGPGPIVTTGRVAGTVSAANAGVSGAQIALGSIASTTTSTSGEYTFSEVPAGSHVMTVTPPGGFTLAPGETANKTTDVVVDQTSTVNWTLAREVPPPKTVDVRLDASRFTPSDVTIVRGDTIRWVNSQPIAHTITPDSRTMPGTWRAQSIPARAGTTFSHTFDVSGVFTYNCTIHIGMRGVIRVP